MVRANPAEEDIAAKSKEKSRRSRQRPAASSTASGGAGAARSPNHTGRFEAERREAFDDGWEGLGDLDAFKTTVFDDPARTIITRNDSPDISFDRSINPYRGCEHGCIYCFARPTHCFLGHSAGLDFETKLYARTNAAELLEKELSNPRYEPACMAIGTNTDPYQPIERERRIMRSILEVLERTSHPVGIVTKSSLITRDIDILSRMAKRGLARAAISITTLDGKIARVDGAARADADEAPRSRAPAGRSRHPDDGDGGADHPRPHRPGDRAHPRCRQGGGCARAGYVMLRLPLEIKVLFREWLAAEFPDRADRVIHLLQSMHGGRDYTSEFGVRQRGTGPYAEQIGMRFRLAIKRLGFNEDRAAAAHRPVPAPRARRATNAAFLRVFLSPLRHSALTSPPTRSNLPRHGECCRRIASATDLRAGGGGAAVARRPGRRRR